MGQAKERGTFEERRAQALAKQTQREPVSVTLSNGDTISTAPIGRIEMRRRILLAASLAALSLGTNIRQR